MPHEATASFSISASGARKRFAVLGGGISGLAAAYRLASARSDGARVEEFLIEARDRLGGTIRTERVEGFLVEGGPDSFLGAKPEAAALCRELGLEDSLLGSNDTARRTYILHHGRLVPLPEGLALFAPTRLWPLAATPLLPWRSKLKVFGEYFRSTPSGELPADESVSSFVERHFGSDMVETIADPLLAGVYGGDSSRLSARSVLPRFWEMERKRGSLTRAALRAGRDQRRVAGASDSGAAAPLFLTLKAGMGQMVDGLRARLEDSRLLLGRRAIAIEKATGRGYRIRSEDGTAHAADALILALPAYECGRLLETLDRPLGEALKSVPYSSAVTVALGYHKSAAESLPRGFGILVPQKEKRRILACTFVHKKFSSRVPPDCVLLRCFLGGARDPGVLDLSDEEIVGIVRREVRAILNVSATPLFHRIYRWPRSMPQYVVGHEALVRSILSRLENHAGLFLAGSAHAGVGISDCVRSGKASAEEALKTLNL